MEVTATQKGFFAGRVQQVGDQFDCPPALFSPTWMAKGHIEVEAVPIAPSGAQPIAESQILGKTEESEPAIGPTKAPITKKKSKKSGGRPKGSKNKPKE